MSERCVRPSGGRRAAWILLLPSLLLLAITGLAPIAAAAELQFSASVNQTTVGLGDQFQLVLTVQSEDMHSVPSPSLPPLPDFNVLGSTSSQATNISIINGQMKQQATISFIYVLAAKRLGKAQIPACKLTYQGKEYLSQPIEITVEKGAQGQAAPSPSAPGPAASRASVPLEGNLFLSVTPNRKTAYVGEPITVEVTLYTRYQIANGGWAAMPGFDGFWAEKMFDATKFAFERRTIDGKVYAVSLLKKAVLFPLSPGKATIKPMAFNVVIQAPPRDIFDMFGSQQSVRVESKPLTLEILPLPENGKPATFTGGVGQLSLAGSLDRATTTNSEPINLTLKISGSGNLRMVDKPEVPPVTGLRILDPEIKDDFHVTSDGVRGSKTLRYPIIPQSDGKFIIAPVKMAYFDPRAKQYKTLETSPLEFSASGSVTNTATVEPQGLKVLGSDINYIKPDAARLPITPMQPPAWPNVLYVVSLGMVGGAFWFRAHSERLMSDRGYARMTRSSGLVKRRLRQAEVLLKKDDVKGFHAALTQAVMGYVGDRFNIDSQAMTRDQLRGELDRLKVPGETAAALLEIVDQCEVARFSPAALDDSNSRELFDRARDVLGRI